VESESGRRWPVVLSAVITPEAKLAVITRRDERDLSDFWNKTKKVDFEVVLEPEATYYPVEKGLSEKIKSVARKQGVSSGTLVNLWLEQRIGQQRSTRRRRKLSAKNASA
jgi:hypothetical protein